MTEFQYLNQGNSEAQDRLATSFLLAQASTGLARTGVLSGLVVAQTTTASSAVTISSGAGNSQDTVGNGAAIMVNDTQKTMDILTGNPVGGTPRNDIVVFDSFTTSIRALIGTPNASPTDPTIPATAIPLARVRNAAGATTIPSSAIDDLRMFTDLVGAPIRVRNATERNALTQFDGLMVNRLDMNYLERSDGTNWVPQVDTFTGSETVVKGSAPPAGTRKIRYCGSQIYTTNASGQFAVTFFAPFPNGLVSLAFTAGDGAGGLRFVVTDEFNTSLAIGVGLAYNGSNTLLTSTNIRINYIAEGW